MLYNYLKIALRKLFITGKDRGYSWINVGGLTLGLTAFVLIGHFVLSELGYDRSFPNYQNIYRLAVKRMESGELTMHSAKTYAGVGNYIVNDIPNIHSFTRVLYEECMFLYEPENIRFNRQRTFWADGNFHELFGLQILSEGQLELLHKPNQAIISESAAERFFGKTWKKDATPIGKTIILNGGVPFMIQGVFKDIVAQSHMQVDVVVSYSTLMALVGDHLNTIMPPLSNFVYNYIVVDDGAKVPELESRINAVVAKNTGELDDQVSYEFSLQALTSIHLDSHLSDELTANGNRLFIWALSLAAVLIIIVAWINFINLTVARAMNRAREVGVRKAIGARKIQLATQFAIETLFSGFIAVLITLTIVFSTRNLFNRIIDVSIPIFSIENAQLWLIFVCMFLIGACLASVYPAMILSSFNPIKALKGKNVNSAGSGYFQQGLIAFQFFAALLLITCTGAVYYQVNSMRRQDLGVDLSQVLVVHSPRSMIGNHERAQYFEQFRDFLEPMTDIVSVASGACLPGEKFLFHTENVHAEGQDVIINWSFDLASVDEQYLPTLGLELIEGRNFEPKVNEENSVVVNEMAIGVLGFQDPSEAIGAFIRINQNDQRQIIGVVADAHFEGLKRSIKPLLLTYGHDYEFGFFPIKINTNQYSKTISKIEAHYVKTYPRDPFEYFFLDEFFNKQYKNDQAFGKLFGSFALLTIFIAGLGLFGLISFITYNKSKEIGIRKVMGASAGSIVKLLTMGFLKLLLVAALIVLPFSHWVIGRWLNTFAYRFEPAWWMYFLPVIVLLVTSMVAVGGQTLKAASKNPVDAIWDE